MDERLSALLAAVDTATLDRVAAGASGIADAVLEAPPQFQELRTARADARTIGIVRVNGGTRLRDGSAGPTWSAVAKFLDLGVMAGGEQQWTRPESEEIVYEERYFAGDGLRFRPARCYAVSRIAGGAKAFWLEDLTNAAQAPFGVEPLAIMARHLGEWSGFHRQVPKLGFPLSRDLYTVRWSLPAYAARYERLQKLTPEAAGRFFRDVPVSALAELRSLLIAQNERCRSLPHGLAFGDCQVGNLFHRPSETVAVDWATLTVDPIGADAGSMIGSMLGRAGLLEVARNERALFDCYMQGLAAAGWTGNRDDVRRAFFCHYGHYLATTVGLMPVVFVNEEWPRAEVEFRMQAPWDELPKLISPIISLYPAYIEELRELAARP